MWYFRKHTILSVPGLVVVLLTVSYGIAFFTYIGFSARRGRLIKGNEFTNMWITFIGMLLGAQALFVLSAYRATSRYLYWTVLWMVYGVLMCLFSLLVTGGYGSVGDSSAA
ncbi:hypothetical protein GGH95_002278, partial [Coemansia sp. RSA 1836]